MVWSSNARLAGVGSCFWAALRWMVYGSGCAGLAVPLVTSMRTLSGRMISIPINTKGDSRPMITMKQARPRALPHWSLRCWVFPAIWSGLPWAPWTTPSKGFKGPYRARYCHRTENPMQVTETPVSPRPRTGMPSRLSWPVMGGPTAHPTGVTLASGDPSNSLTVRWGELGSHPRGAAAPVFVIEAVRGRWLVLAGEEGAGELGSLGSWRQSGLPFRREAAWWSSIHLLAGRAVEWMIFTVLLVEVASGRRRLSGCDDRSRNSGQGVGRRCCGRMGSDLFVGFLEIIFKDLDLILHCANQALHLGVGLLLGALFQILEDCPGFVSYGADAEAGE